MLLNSRHAATSNGTDNVLYSVLIQRFVRLSGPRDEMNHAFPWKVGTKPWKSPETAGILQIPSADGIGGPTADDLLLFPSWLGVAYAVWWMVVMSLIDHYCFFFKPETVFLVEGRMKI